MARTVLTPQNLGTKGGQSVLWADLDAGNLMQYQNTGREVFLVRVGTGGAATITVPSVADPYGRTGDIGPVIITGPETKAFGPFSPPTIWGNGAAQLFINPSALAGSTSVAVISI